MLERGVSCRAAGDDEGVEGGAAEGAGRERRGPGLRADGLDDAAAAEAIVAAWQELEVGRALHAHHAQMVVVGLLRWSGHIWPPLGELIKSTIVNAWKWALIVGYLYLQRAFIFPSQRHCISYNGAAASGLDKCHPQYTLLACFHNLNSIGILNLSACMAHIVSLQAKN